MTDQQSPWVKAPVSNLVRYKPSGIYFARAKVGGKLIRQSLKTGVLSIAKLRLQDLLAGEQQTAILGSEQIQLAPRLYPCVICPRWFVAN